MMNKKRLPPMRIFLLLIFILYSVLVAGIFTRNVPVHAATGDWSSFLGNNARTDFNSSETIINPETVSSLKLHWKYKAGGSISTQIMEVNGLLYWGSWDGYEHATDLNGEPVWSTNLGLTKDKSCFPPSAGVASTAAVASVSINGMLTSVVFVGGGNGNFYALNASTGAVIWETPLGSSPNHFLWSSPAFYNGSIYEGVSSFGDCPLVQGRLVQMDATSGAIQNIFKVVPNNCIGAGVWTAPTINETTNMLYFSTGNGGTCSTPETRATALVELSATNLSFISSWRVPASQRNPDSDFGSTPTLFNATINGISYDMVGLLNKNGIYYAFDQDDIGAGPLWEVQLATYYDSYPSSAWDGTSLYISSAGTKINGMVCTGGLQALNPATGAFLWRDCLHALPYAPVLSVPGLVIAMCGQHIIAVDATTGKRLFNFQDTNGPSNFWGAATISNGVLYEGNMDGYLYAFGT